MKKDAPLLRHALSFATRKVRRKTSLVEHVWRIVYAFSPGRSIGRAKKPGLRVSEWSPRSVNPLSADWPERKENEETRNQQKIVGDIVRNLLKSYRLPWKFDAPSRIGKIGQGIGIACANIAMAIGGDFLNMGFDLGSDFVLYLDSDHGQKIRDRLKHQILALAAKHPEGLALVAHSLGSVIAYDVVAEAVCNKHPLPVKQLITFGSPLAWTFELRNDEGKRECAFVSVGNTRWANFYYEEDYVPIRKPLPETQFPTVENRLLKLPNDENKFSSHTAYWKDAVFAAEVRKLIEV